MSNLTDKQKLQRIAQIIERVDTRASAEDGPCRPTLQVMEQGEISEIYRLAKEPGQQLSAPQPAEGWRPIAEAPRDGSEFLARRSNGSGYEVIRWNESEEWFCGTSGEFVEHGWLSHWQPLPAPPSGERGEG